MLHPKAKAPLTPSPPIALGAYFALLGVACGAWVTRLPEIKRRLGVDEGQLGQILLASALGALVTMPLTGRLVPLVGGRRLAWLTAAGLCLALPLIPWAPSPATLMAVFGLFGAIGGIYSVVLNAQGVLLERAAGRSIMSTLHGLFSLGGLIGAMLGAALIHARVAAVPALVGVAGGQALVYLWAGPGLPKGTNPDDPAPSARQGWRWPPARLAALGALALLGLVGEGSMGDWSAVYLRQSLGADEALAALGYASFSLGMTAGRFAGDALTHRHGDRRILRDGAILAAVGLGGAIALGRPATAIVGFGLVGLGLANAVPILYRGAAQTPGLAPMAGIATASTIGYLGFLAGPALIGQVARATTLGTALGVVAGAIVVIALNARLIRDRPVGPDRSSASSSTEPLTP